MIGWASRWTRTPSATPLQPKNWNVHFWITFNFWWSAEWSKQKTLTKNPKKWKRPPKSSKNKMFIFGLCSTSDDWPNDLSKKHWPKCKKKSPLSHWKMKCSFLDYIQLLMIGQAIRAKNIEQTIKKWKRPPKSLKNKMFVLGLCSTSDDQPSNLSNKHQPKHKKNEKGPLSHQKIKCSFLDYVQLLMISHVHFWITSNPSKKHQPKCKKTKKAPQVIKN